MVSSFTNFGQNLGTQSFDETEPLRLWQPHTEDECDVIIRAVYKQVLGNIHVMDSERLITAESQLKNGSLTVRGFVRQVAKSDLYRARFFEPCSRNRFIELNFKHLLGRAPDTYDDIAHHSHLLETGGWDAEIDAYLDSDEYQQVFGEDTVPYYRGQKTQTGQKLVGFTYLFELMRGAASSDKDVQQRARLNQPIMANMASRIRPMSTPLGAWQRPLVASPRQPISTSSVSIPVVSTPSISPPPSIPIWQYSSAVAYPSSGSTPKDKLGTQPFDETAPVRLWQTHASEEDFDIVIRAVYKQVLGNTHVMDSERLITAESQLKNGELSVCEFVRQVAKSDLYRSRFFEPCSRNRFIELNFKHLLGRAPEGYDDIAHHSHLLETGGFEVEIDAYLDSDEYQQAFGENIVPYYRGQNTQTGQKLVGFAHLFQLLRGAASSDKDAQQNARLNQSLMANTASPIKPVSASATPWQPLLEVKLGQRTDTLSTPGGRDVKTMLASVLSTPTGYTAVPTWVAPASSFTMPSGQTETKSEGPAPEHISDTIAQQQYQSAYQPFKEVYLPFTDQNLVECFSNASADDIEIVIRAVYRQVLGNAHVMESERLVSPESQLKNGTLSVREFIRQVAKSELYRSRFFENCYWYRAIELNHKHLLGRAPQSFEEMKAHSAVLDTKGYEADIDSYLDSDEYQTIFGENIVPYYRGYTTQPGQNMLAFTNMLKLLKSASSSDKDLTGGNKPRLTKAIIDKSPYGKQKVQNVQALITEALRATTLSDVSSTSATSPAFVADQALQMQFDEQEALIHTLQAQLSDLKPLSVIGSAITRQSQWSASSPNGSGTHGEGQPQSAVATVAPNISASSLQQKIDDQAAMIEQLKQEIADARPLATIAEARLNKWRQKSFG
ncbi:MAG: phycobilisome rod-core linker polypeptide [Cyanobacteria bacterium P01_D01_bin.44]